MTTLDEMLFSVFPRLLQLRFIAATLGWWYICETQSETLISRPNRDGRWGFPRNLHDRHFPSHLYQLPILLTFSHTHSCPFPSSPYPSAPPLLIICSSGPKKCSSANLTLKTFWKKSFHFLQPLSRLRSPFLHSKHNFRNIFTRISRQCDVKSSFVELLKCKFKSPFLFNIGIWFDPSLMGSCREV